MKKIVCFLLILIVLLITAGCTVNDTTGLIEFKNLSDKAISNVKVGNTYIGYLAKGQKYDYYYSVAVTGEMAGEGIDYFWGNTATTSIQDPDLSYKLNYFYDISIAKNGDGKYIMVAGRGTKPGSNSYDYPAD